MKFRRALLLALGLVVAILCAAMAWLSPEASGPVTIHFAGTTNFNNRTMVLFAITNRYATNIRGSSFQLIKTTTGWTAAAPPLRYATAPGRRDLWLSAGGTTNDGTVIGVVPPASGEWTTVFDQDQYGSRKVPWRDRVVDFLYLHRFLRLARWLHPSDEWNREWAKDPNLVVGPRMRGTQPD